MKRIEFTDDELAKMLTMYNQNNTQKKIAEEFNVSRSVIKRVLQENEIKLRKTTHKFYANYDIFETIDTVEKAYWLGFLAADGCNYQREENASIIINIHQKDLNHLQKFKDFCETNAEIKTFIQNSGFSNHTPMCKIVLNSKKMSQDLADKGIIPRKSLKLEKPNIDEKFYLPFILGYFDGDGSVFKLSGSSNFGIEFVGTKEFLMWVNEILKISTSYEKRNKDNNSNNYYIRCGGTKKPYEILSKLYNSCNIHLDRKFEIYKNLETVVLSRNI